MMFTFDVHINRILVDGKAHMNFDILIFSKSNSRPMTDEVINHVKNIIPGKKYSLAGNDWKYKKK